MGGKLKIKQLIDIVEKAKLNHQKIWKEKRKKWKAKIARTKDEENGKESSEQTANRSYCEKHVQKRKTKGCEQNVKVVS